MKIGALVLSINARKSIIQGQVRRKETPKGVSLVAKAWASVVCSLQGLKFKTLLVLSTLWGHFRAFDLVIVWFVWDWEIAQAPELVEVCVSWPGNPNKKKTRKKERRRRKDSPSGSSGWLKFRRHSCILTNFTNVYKIN